MHFTFQVEYYWRGQGEEYLYQGFPEMEMEMIANDASGKQACEKWK